MKGYQIIFTLVFSVVAAAWLYYLIDDWWEGRKRSKLDAQIKAGIVPVNYESVAKVARDLNESQDLTHPKFKGPVQSREFRERVDALKRIRRTVADIRAAGYDQAKKDQAGPEIVLFHRGVKSAPYPTGSGEAKQWVRGYCMGYGATDIKQYYDAA